MINVMPNGSEDHAQQKDGVAWCRGVTGTSKSSGKIDEFIQEMLSMK